MTQDDAFQCECGQHAVVTPTSSPWEFDVACACGRALSLSWAHHKPAPIFAPPARMPMRAVEQPLLWDV